MLMPSESSVEKRELGRHFLGVYTLRGSSQQFFLENNIFRSDEYESRILDESLGMKFSLNLNKIDILRTYEFRNSHVNLFFGGEIYNSHELCHDLDIPERDRLNLSLAELSSLLYARYGISFASMINGIFSIVLMDFNDNVLILYSDRFGSAKPIYYYHSDKLIFASQLKLLLQCDEVSREIDNDSLAIFLKYSYIPAPRTIIQGINKLNPGEVLIFQNSKIKKFRYIDFQVKRMSSANKEAAAEAYIERLRTSIHRKMKGFDSGRIGFFLSGGLDSSANVALTSINGDKNFRTFGIGFDNPDLDERPYASLVAKHFGVEFLDYVFDGSEIEDLPRMVWYLDEPFMENGLFLTYAGFKAPKDHTDLIIAGDGADQLFGTGGFAQGRPIALRYLLDKFRCQALLDKSRKFIFNPPYKDNLFFKSKVMIDRAVDFKDWFFWGFDDRELDQLCNF